MYGHVPPEVTKDDGKLSIRAAALRPDPSRPCGISTYHADACDKPRRPLSTYSHTMTENRLSHSLEIGIIDNPLMNTKSQERY